MKSGGTLLLLLAILSSSAACARPSEPVQPLQRVSESAKLRVKHRLSVAPKGGDSSEMQGLHRDAERAIVEQLRAAGYEVVDHGKYDVGMTVSIQTQQDRGADPEFRRAEVIFLDRHDRVVDRIAFEMKPGAAPAREPTRVANLLVNGAVESKKLSAFAEKRRDRNARTEETEE